MYKKPNFYNAWICTATHALELATGRPHTECEAYARKQAMRTEGKIIKQSVNTETGDFELKTESLYKHMTQTCLRHITTPSGSVYYNTEQLPSVISQMVTDRQKERSKIKKQQFEATSVGDTDLALFYKYQQSTIKVNLNALPGGYGSEHNIFYDKGGYNSITSSARSMIARAYITAERLLGGNFGWFSLEEAINHIVQHTRRRDVSDDVLRDSIRTYGLRYPSVDEVYEYIRDGLIGYCPTADTGVLRTMLSRCSDVDLAWLWYYCNLRHLFWETPGMKERITSLFDIDPARVRVEDATAKDIKDIPGPMQILVSVAFSDVIESVPLDVILTKRTDLIPVYVGLAREFSNRIQPLSDLVSLWTNSMVDVPDITHQPLLIRNTVIISDTDSIIFTANEWDSWYKNNDSSGVTKESYQITSLVIYWLHYAVQYALYRFSCYYGVSDDKLRVLAMKNEFLYPIILLFDIKKTYAGVQMVQEGVILPKPKPDIKGQQLRGSKLCNETLDFTEDLIVNRVLNPAISGKISGMDLIQRVVELERHIMQSVRSGNVDYLAITSLKPDNEYKDSEQVSVMRAWFIWESVFGNTYGHIRPPLKVPLVPVVTPDQRYLDSLPEKMRKGFRLYFEKYPKFPSNLIVDPQYGKIPKEMMPLVAVRDVVKANLAPAYLVLERLGLTLGPSKWNLLFSDCF